jgi:hypothetical protein
LALDARMFTIDIESISFRIWIGLGGHDSGPIPSSEQKQRAFRRAGRLISVIRK